MEKYLDKDGKELKPGFYRQNKLWLHFSGEYDDGEAILRDFYRTDFYCFSPLKTKLLSRINYQEIRSKISWLEKGLKE